jgi:hypothetical protein
LDNPFERIEGSDKGISKQDIIMDKLTIGTTVAIRNTPAESLGGTGKNFGTAGRVLKADKVRGRRLPHRGWILAMAARRSLA